MKQAAELALFDADNPAIQLITKDDGGTPAGAMAAADAAIAEGAEIILGPLFGKSATAVAPIAAKANVPVIAFSNDPEAAGRGVYLMSYLASEEVDRVGQLCCQQRQAAVCGTDPRYRLRPDGRTGLPVSAFKVWRRDRRL